MSPRYVVRRLGQVLPTSLAIVVLTFLLVHLAPGDPVLALAGQHGDAEYYAQVRHRFGLDRPFTVQLATYVGNLVRGDLGVSYVHGRSALDVVLERLPATLLLAATAFVISTTAGTVLGTVAARRAGGVVDASARVSALLGYATPSFWLAQVALLVFAFRLELFPLQGMTDPRAAASGLAHVVDVARHLVLPALVLAATELALTTRLVRSGVLETSRAAYVRTARAKGLGTGRVLWHTLRSGLLPVVTVLGGRIGMFFTGAVLVETVFAWPGIGRLLLASAQARDVPVLLAIFVLVAFAVVLTNLVTDLVYARLDPRVRYD